jgi:hypothetical protein
MVECNHASTPMEETLKLTSKEGNELEDETRYTQLVRSLIYLTTTRSNNSFVIGILSRFMQKPFEGHWFVEKIFIKYLKATQDFRLNYSKVDDFNLIGYCDSDFVRDKENGVSTSRYLMILGSTLVSQRSHKQSVPIDSTTKVEYVASLEATKEIVLLRKILEYLQEK